MAERLLKTKRQKIAPAKPTEEEPKKVVLVGTYAGSQLTDWPGFYPYPLSSDDKVDAESCAKVNEIWLFKGTKEPKYFAAEFVGIKTREELKALGYPAKGKGHGDGTYLLFKIEKTYAPASSSAALAAAVERVIVRTKDFARSPKVRKQLKVYLESTDRTDKELAAQLPSIITKLPAETLRVCEAAVQLTFFMQMMEKQDERRQILESERPIGIDLFAGCGGLSLGFEQAGFDIVAAVEIDPIHAAVHEYNFPGTKTICSDIKNISGADIRRLANIGDRDVDIVFGGAPCQGFSMIGKRALDDPRNQLISHYLRIVSEIHPKYCVLENVKGLTVGKHAQFLTELIAELRRINYSVLLPYRVLNAAKYGVPQNRERLFLIAAREDQVLPEYPDEHGALVSVREAIADIPDADRYEQLLTDDSVAVKWQTRFAYARQLRGLDDDVTNFGYDRVYPKDRLTASWRTVHGDVSMQRFLAAPQGETEPHSRFFKLSWGGQCNTLRAGTDSARGGFTSPRPIHPELPRVITVREAARIHSYPDWFRFNKTKWHGFREIGNSVPPRLARAVGSSVIAALGVIPRKPQRVITPGDESLLCFDMRAAADYFGVSRNVIAQRKRKDNGK